VSHRLSCNGPTMWPTSRAKCLLTLNNRYLPGSFRYSASSFGCLRLFLFLRQIYFYESWRDVTLPLLFILARVAFVTTRASASQIIPRRCLHVKFPASMPMSSSAGWICFMKWTQFLGRIIIGNMLIIFCM